MAHIAAQAGRVVGAVDAELAVATAELEKHLGEPGEPVGVRAVRTVAVDPAGAVQRLEQLLARAHKVEESIAIERELERVVGEIERLEGRLKFLQDRAQFSTIAVTFASRPKELVAKGSFRLPFFWFD